MSNSALMWTKDRPVVDGYYWVNFDNGGESILELVKIEGDDVWFCAADEQSKLDQMCDRLGSYWYGPLSNPPENEMMSR